MNSESCFETDDIYKQKSEISLYLMVSPGVSFWYKFHLIILILVDFQLYYRVFLFSSMYLLFKMCVGEIIPKNALNTFGTDTNVSVYIYFIQIPVDTGPNTYMFIPRSKYYIIYYDHHTHQQLPTTTNTFQLFSYLCTYEV